MYEHPTHFVKTSDKRNGWGYPCIRVNNPELGLVFIVQGGAAHGEVIRSPNAREVKPWPPFHSHRTRGVSTRESLVINWDNGKSILGGEMTILREEYRHTEHFPEGAWIPLEVVPFRSKRPSPVLRPTLRDDKGKTVAPEIRWEPAMGRGTETLDRRFTPGRGFGPEARSKGADKDAWLNNPNIAAAVSDRKLAVELDINLDILDGDWEADADAFFAE